MKKMYKNWKNILKYPKKRMYKMIIKRKLHWQYLVQHSWIVIWREFWVFRCLTIPLIHELNSVNLFQFENEFWAKKFLSLNIQSRASLLETFTIKLKCMQFHTYSVLTPERYYTLWKTKTIRHQRILVMHYWFHFYRSGISVLLQTQVWFHRRKFSLSEFLVGTLYAKLNSYFG